MGNGQPAPSVDFDGTWFNQHRSRMEIKVAKTGELSGRYATAVGAPKPKDWFPLTGFASEDQISFTVNFGSFGSLTAWVGQHTEDLKGDARIVTFWHLTKNVKDPEEPTKLWATVLTGSDVFTRSDPGADTLQIQRLHGSHPLNASALSVSKSAETPGDPSEE